MNLRACLRLIFPLLLCLAPWNLGFGQAPVVDLAAAKLRPGPLERWPNAGTLGGWFASGVNAPRVENVAGRPAVTFTGKADFLKASFAAPPSLTGGHSFSFIAWVLDPGIGGKKVIGSWAALPAGSAEVGIGRGRNAAFTYSPDLKIGFEGGVPESGVWHHVAVVYDQKILKVYLNGRLNAEKSCGLAIRGGGQVLLGAGWDARKNAAVLPFAGSLAQVKIYDRAMSARDVRNGMGYEAAFDPAPKDGDVVEGLKTFLRWAPGSSEAVSANVYFGPRRSELEKADPRAPAFLGNFPASAPHSDDPLPLAPGVAYYWRADGIDRSGRVRWPGEIWHFTAGRSAASKPSPRPGIAAVKPGLTEVTWKPGRYAVSQDLSFDASFEKVRDGTSVRAKGLSARSGRFRIPLTLDSGRTYYWRVDTDNGALPRALGEIWSFRVADVRASGDVTFFMASDLHYGASVTAVRANRATIDAMNSLPGTPYPSPLGGSVRTPEGVVLLGDIVDDGNGSDAEEVWGEFVADYGVDGEGRIVYPVYEGAGNHDGDPRNPSRRGIQARNRLRPAVKTVSASGLHYSWNWDRFHFIHLNLFAGSSGDDIINPWGTKFQGDWKLPQHSLEFLIDDLAKNVGRSGRPVVLFQHYGWDKWSLGWWSERERTAYYEALKAYNIVAVFWGHSHEPQRIDWNGIPTFCVGSANKELQPAEFFVVHLTSRSMTVAERKGNRWGLAASIPIR